MLFFLSKHAVIFSTESCICLITYKCSISNFSFNLISMLFISPSSRSYRIFNCGWFKSWAGDIIWLVPTRPYGVCTAEDPMFIVLELWITLLGTTVEIWESVVLAGCCSVIGLCSTAGLTTTSSFLVKFRTPLLTNFSSSCTNLFEDNTGVRALFFCYFWISTSELGFDDEVLEKVVGFPIYFSFPLILSLSFSFSFSLKQTLLIGVSCPVSLNKGDCIFRRS